MNQKKISDKWLMVIGMLISIVLSTLIAYAIKERIVIFAAIWFPLGIGIGKILQQKYGSNPNQERWEDLSPKQKKVRISIIVLLSLTLIAGVVTFFLYM